MREIIAKKSVRSPGGLKLASYLIEEIESGRMLPGQKLPAERELCEQFAVSRGSVRRVLTNLKELNLITQTVGSGTFVTANAGEVAESHNRALNRIEISPAELMAARLLIEPQMPALIVLHATNNDFDKMDHCIARSEAATTIDEFEYWDGELHKEFAFSTHNAFFLQILTLTNEVRDRGEWGLLKRKSLTAERRDLYQQQHRDIVKSLRDRDEKSARDLLYEHLFTVQKNLFDPGGR